MKKTEIDPKISIIIPVYNGEKYIDRCLESVVDQTFTDIEVIIIDDGSTDGSMSKIITWENFDSRIRVIHKKNGGLSSARNAGLEIAKGKFVGFVDIDDWIEPNMYSYLYDLIRKHNADFASIEMISVSNERKHAPKRKEVVQIANQDLMLKKYLRLSGDKITYCVCDKLYSRNAIGNIRFFEGLRFEDLLFNYYIIKNSKVGVYSNKCKYYYFKNRDGITRNALVKEDLQILKIWKHIYNMSKKDFPEYQKYVKFNFERAHMGLLAKGIRYGINPKFDNYFEYDMKLKNRVKKKYSVLIMGSMPLSRKILLTFICLCPNIIKNFFSSIRRIF